MSAIICTLLFISVMNYFVNILHGNGSIFYDLASKIFESMWRIVELVVEIGIAQIL